MNILLAKSMRLTSCLIIYAFFIASYIHKNNYPAVVEFHVRYCMHVSLPEATDDETENMYNKH